MIVSPINYLDELAKPIIPKSTGDVNKPITVSTQAKTLTLIPALFLFATASIVQTTVTTNAKGTNIVLKNNMPRTASAQAIIPYTMPFFLNDY